MGNKKKRAGAFLRKEISEGAFVKRVTVISLVVLIILLAVFSLAWQNRDSLCASVSRMQAGQGRFDGAVKTAEMIVDDDIRLSSQYAIAQIMYDSGAYASASQLFGNLGDFSDSADRKMMCDYALADGLYQAGEYQNALTAFAALGDYSDSLLRQQEVIYAMAEEASGSDDIATAVTLYLSVAEYGDSYDKAYEIALSLTGDRDMALNMLESGGQTPEAMEKMLQIAERRALLPDVFIAAGAYHTVVLYADGTVGACGDDSYGQCQVKDWKNIVQIAAGAYHTVGLKADGTVVAVGKNDQGQCDVGEFTGISQIAAGDSDTYALDAGGQVHMTGYHDYESITRAAGVRNIYAGSYSAVAETSNGTFVASHQSCTLMPSGQILSLGIQTGYYVVQYMDGTTVSSFDIGGDWENISWLDVGPNAILAADLSGNVRSYFFRESSAVDLSGLRGIVQCAAGTSHYVFLDEEGNLSALGDNTYGQCNVEQLNPVAQVDTTD